MRDWQAFVRSRLSLPDLTPARERRVVAELAAQLEDFYHDALARGMEEREADRHARRQVEDWGRLAADVSGANRRHRAAAMDRLANRLERPAFSSRGGAVPAGLIRDAHHAVRQLARNPGFTAVAVLTLALGIGAATAIFSVVNGVLLRPLPYGNPDRLVRVHELVPQYGRFSVSPAAFLDWRRDNRVFTGMAAFVAGSGTFTGGAGPERVAGASVSWDLFDLLEVTPVVGRGFREDEDAPGRNNVIVLSHGFWQRRFGGDPAVLGTVTTLGGTPVSIIGVMPAGFYFPTRDTEFWRPVALNPASATRGGHYLYVVARLLPGVPLERAGAEMETIAERLAQEYPESSAGESAEILTLQEQVVGNVRPALLTLLAAVSIVMLVACVNVANLLLVRSSVRQKEMAIRASLGAGRRRIALQMLTESLVLALLAGSLGLLLAHVLISPIQALGAGTIPRVDDVVIDSRILLFVLGMSLVTGIVFGLAPAWQASQSGPGAMLKEGGRATGGTGGRFVRSSLIVAEVALSIVLLVGAALLLRSFTRLIGVDPGFDARGALAFRVSLPPARYAEGQGRVALFDRLLENLQALAGVEAVGMAQALPMRGDYVLSVSIEGRPEHAPGQEPSANYRSISPGYFKALGIPLVRGRVFTPADAAGAAMVAIVDESFVRFHFGNEDPLGRGIDIGNGTDGYCRIVGVVGSVHHEGLEAAPDPTMYVPFPQDDMAGMWIVARTRGDVGALAPAARQVLRDIDPELPAYSMTPLAELVSDSVAERRFSMLLLAAFAAVGLILAAVGLYGVVAFSVSRRTQEIGVRMAMGAGRRDVLRMVVADGMKLAVVGAALGLAAALALSRLMTTMLFEVKSLDPASYLAPLLLVLAVAAFASFVPARRATRVDPIAALRSE